MALWRVMCIHKRRLNTTSITGDIPILWLPLIPKLMLRANKELRRIDSCKGIYINRDLTPAEAEAAYLLRQKRRERRDRLQATTDGAHTGNATVYPSGNTNGSADSV